MSGQAAGVPRGNVIKPLSQFAAGPLFGFWVTTLRFTLSQVFPAALQLLLRVAKKAAEFWIRSRSALHRVGLLLVVDEF